MHKLHFLTAGIPLSTKPKKTIITGLKRIKELGLDGMEIEYVRGIVYDVNYIKEVGKIAKDLKLVLTAHAPYFINLFSSEKRIIDKSYEYILDTARLLDYANGYSIVFHAAYYLEKKPELVYKSVKEHIEHISQIASKEALKIWIRPELMGKKSQFGNLEEIIKLSKEINGKILPCIDLAHLHARTNGKFNSYEEWARLWDFMGNELGEESLKNVHLHFSGIKYTDKGEQKHINLKDSQFRYREFLKSLIDYDIYGVIVCESPNIEGDTLMMKKTYLSM